MSDSHVKGSLVRSAAQGLRDAVATGQIEDEALEKRLSAGSLEILDTDPILAAWYPVTQYSEILDVHWELRGARDPDFMRRTGEAAASALIEGGMVQALAVGNGGRGLRPVDVLLGRARSALALTQLLYDFIEVSVEHDEETQTLHLLYDNAALFSEAMFLTAHGFVNAMASRIRAPGPTLASASSLVWRARRPDPNRLVFSHDTGPLLNRAD